MAFDNDITFYFYVNQTLEGNLAHGEFSPTHYFTFQYCSYPTLEGILFQKFDFLAHILPSNSHFRQIWKVIIARTTFYRLFGSKKYKKPPARCGRLNANKI